MADLLIFVGTVALLVGAWSLIKPIQRIGITDRRRARQVALAGLIVGMAGSALAENPQSNREDAPLGIEEAPPATVAAPPSTTSTVATTTTTTSLVTTTIGWSELDEATATVISVTDGDTIRVRFPDGSQESVRLIGIDAPEPGEAGGAAAAQVLRGLLRDAEVTLTRDVSNRDPFDRLLRYVWLGDRFVNDEVVGAGVAVAKRYPPDTAYADVLEAAQSEAQTLAVGLWTTTTSTTLTTSTTTTSTTVLALVSPPTTATPNCHPSYTGACVPVGVEDVDCAGGSGNGPYYVGRVTVVGPDVYGLDRDGEGIGCENS